VLKQGKIVQVDSARFVVGMEEQLLSAGQARHTHTAERALLEGFWRIVELPPAEVGLAAVTGCIEDDRVDVDPTAALSDQFDTDWSPVSLHAVSPALQNAQRHCLVAGVHGQVKVTVQSGVSTNQSIDTPTAGDPNGTAGLGQVPQYPKHLTKTHALACSVGPHYHLRSHPVLPESSITQRQRHGVLRDGQRS
jgi:hypothetical protein